MFKSISTSLLIFFSINALAQEGYDEIQKRLVMEAKARQEAVTNASRACTAMTQEDDVRDRNLAKNIQTELGDSCIAQKPSLTAAENLDWQIKNSLKFVNVSDIWEDVTQVALERTLFSFWGTHMRLIKDEKLTEKSAFDLVCKHAFYMCRKPEDIKNIKNIFASFQKELLTSPIKFMTGLELATIKQNEFKPLVDNINKSCAMIKQKDNEIRDLYNCLEVDLSGNNLKDPSKSVPSKPIKIVDGPECHDRKLLEKAARKKLQKIGMDVIGYDLQLLGASQLAPLLITENLRTKMGDTKTPDAVYKNCMEGKGKFFNDVYIVDLQNAQKDFFNLQVDALKQIGLSKLGDVYDAKKEETLKQYLKTNPSVVAEVLKRRSNPTEVLAMCSFIRNIQDWDKARKVTGQVLAGFGVVVAAGSMVYGGPPAGVAISKVVFGGWMLAGDILAAATIIKATSDYQSDKKQDAHIRSAVATKQKELQQALTELQASDERKEDAITTIKWTAGAELLSIVSRGVIYHKGITADNYYSNMNKELLSSDPAIRMKAIKELGLVKINPIKVNGMTADEQIAYMNTPRIKLKMFLKQPQITATEKSAAELALKNYEHNLTTFINQYKPTSVTALNSSFTHYGSISLDKMNDGLSIKLKKERLNLAKSVLGLKTLTPAQEAAIMKAHFVPMDLKADAQFYINLEKGVGKKITQPAVFEKNRILNKEFTPAQIRLLMDKNIVGTQTYIVKFFNSYNEGMLNKLVEKTANKYGVKIQWKEEEAWWVYKIKLYIDGDPRSADLAKDAIDEALSSGRLKVYSPGGSWGNFDYW